MYAILLYIYIYTYIYIYVYIHNIIITGQLGLRPGARLRRERGAPPEQLYIYIYIYICIYVYMYDHFTISFQFAACSTIRRTLSGFLRYFEISFKILKCVLSPDDRGSAAELSASRREGEARSLPSCQSI